MDFKFRFIGDIVSTIFKPINTWQERKSDVKKAKHAMEMAEIEFKTQLILNKESHNQNWEIESLKVSKDKKWMQWISFIVLGLPFVIAWFNPELVQQYFEVSLAVIPEYYQKMFISIIGVIWGVAQLKNVSDGIAGSIAKNRKVDVKQIKEVSGKKIIRPSEKYDVFKKIDNENEGL